MNVLENTESTLWVAHTLPSCTVLGPGHRGVIWVSGCSRSCRGCIGEPLRRRESGKRTSVARLAAEISAWPAIEGLTLSGGEPFEQAGPLADLLETVQRVRDLSVLCYSGFTLDELERTSDPQRRRLLSLIDILVDGPFVEERHRDLLWRGSDNQRIHLLTERYAFLRPQLEHPGAGMELWMDPDGAVFWIGVPAPGFFEEIGERLRDRGVVFHETEEIWS